MTRPAQRRELAEKAVATKGVSITLACRAFGVSETCFRYSPKRDDENEMVVRSLNQIIEWRGAPRAIRVDNGPEYVSGTLMEWAENRGITLSYIQPGKPQQNAFVERYNRTVRHEWLNLYIFESIEEVQQIATEWLWSYNHERPNMGNGGMTPAQKLRMAA